MTDPKLVAREVFIEYAKDGWREETLIEALTKAILSERTTAYKAGMERAAEITKLWDRTTPERIVAEEIAQAIRTEANKEIK